MNTKVNDGKKHLSHSQISMLLRCPRQYMYRYIEGLKIPAGAQLLLGTCYHAALEANFRSKVQTGRDVETDKLISAYESAWWKRVGEEEIDWQDMSPAQVKDEGISLVQAYMETVAPFTMPARVEEKFSICLPGLDGYTLDGIIDLITDAGIIIDHKTAARSKTQSDCDKDLQPYAYAAAVLTDPTLDEIEFEYQVAIKKKAPEIQRITTRRNRADVEWYIDLACECVRQIRAAVFPPNPNGWHCDRKWCGYWDLCKKGGAR